MKAYKDKQYLVFDLGEGKTVKYNLATKETIGVSGKVVKNINTQLRNISILNMIDSFEDENYKNFLSFLDKYFINKSSAYENRFYRNPIRVSKVGNIGTFLSRIGRYDYFEQYFACGLKKVDSGIKYKLTELPKGLIKLCKNNDILLNNSLVENYRDNPNLFNDLLDIEYITLNKNDLLATLQSPRAYDGERFFRIIQQYNYNPIFLCKYIDSIMTLEALTFIETLGELSDYCRMMHTISNKYTKYPKNLLTSHRIAVRNYNRLKTQYQETAFEKRINTKLECSIGKYSIIYPKTTQEIKEEAVQQNHCVASYIDRVIDGQCDIVFLRKTENLDKSLITLELREGKIVQARGKFNRDPSTEERKILDKYSQKLLKIYKKPLLA